MRNKFFDGKKIDPVEFVNAVASIEEKLDTIIELLGQDVGRDDSVFKPPPIAKLDPNIWLNKAREYLGIDEDADEEKVIALSKLAGTPIASSETPWCAIFVNAILADCGFATTGTMRARDFENYGEECEEKVGAIVVYKSHVGFVPEIGKCLGGNQSDGVNIGEQRWYGAPIAYRFPKT